MAGVRMFSPVEGREANIHPDDVPLARQQGWVDGGKPAEGGGGLKSFATQIAERGASGATLGLSDVALAATLGDDYRERRAARDEEWGGLGDIAELGGAIAPALATGGESLAARGLAATPAGMLAKATGRLAEGGGVARLAATGAIEGAAQAGGHQLSEEALSGYYGGFDAVAERILAAAGHGAVWGGVAGGGLGAVEKGVRAGFAGRGTKLEDMADTAAFRAVNPGVRVLGDLERDAGAAIRNYRGPDGQGLIRPLERSDVLRGRVRDELDRVRADRVTAKGEMDSMVQPSVSDPGPLKRATIELEAARADATFAKQRLNEALEPFERDQAVKALTSARNRMKAAQLAQEQAAGASKSLPFSATDEARRSYLSGKMSEVDEITPSFARALKGAGRDEGRLGDLIQTGGMLSAIMHGSPLGLMAAAAGSAAREAGRRAGTTWAYLIDRAAKGDPMGKMAAMLGKTTQASAKTAAWSLTPDQYQEIRSKVRQLATGQGITPFEFSDVAPETANAALAAKMRAVQHLEQTAPQPPKQTDNPNVAIMVGQRPPDHHAIRRWARRVKAIDDPYSILMNPTKEGGEAVAFVYPKLFAAMRADLMNAVSSHPGAISLERKAALSMTFGLPLDPSLGAHVMQLNQLAYARLREKRAARPQRPQAMAISRRIMGPSEELAEDL